MTLAGKVDSGAEAARVPRWKALVVWCAGGDSELLELCPSERGRFVQLGFMVVASTLVAGASAGIAFGVVVGARAGMLGTVLAAGIWALLVFTLNRSITALPLNPVAVEESTGMVIPPAERSRIERARSIGGSLITIGWRVVIAAVIAWLIGKPIEFVIFDAEIEQHLANVREAELSEGLERVDQAFSASMADLADEEAELTASSPELAESLDELAAIHADLIAAEEEAANLAVELRAERQGVDLGAGITSGAAGDGPVAEAIAAQLELAENRVSSLTERRDQVAAQVDAAEETASGAADRAAARLGSIEAERTALISQRDADEQAVRDQAAAIDGLVARNEALEWLKFHELGDPIDAPGERNSTWLLIWGLTLIIFGIEMMPSLMKITLAFSSNRAYDELDAVRRWRDRRRGAQELRNSLQDPQPVGVSVGEPKPTAGRASAVKVAGAIEPPTGASEVANGAVTLNDDTPASKRRRPQRRKPQYSYEVQAAILEAVRSLIATGSSQTAAIKRVAERDGYPSAETIRGWLVREQQGASD